VRRKTPLLIATRSIAALVLAAGALAACGEDKDYQKALAAAKERKQARVEAITKERTATAVALAKARGDAQRALSTVAAKVKEGAPAAPATCPAARLAELAKQPTDRQLPLLTVTRLAEIATAPAADVTVAGVRDPISLGVALEDKDFPEDERGMGDGFAEQAQKHLEKLATRPLLVVAFTDEKTNAGVARFGDKAKGFGGHVAGQLVVFERETGVPLCGAPYEAVSSDQVEVRWEEHGIGDMDEKAKARAQDLAVRMDLSHQVSLAYDKAIASLSAGLTIDTD
jgi:hypothetical protein